MILPSWRLHEMGVLAFILFVCELSTESVPRHLHLQKFLVAFRGEGSD